MQSNIAAPAPISGTVVSITASAVSYAAVHLPLVQFIAACVAIVAGLLSIWWSVKKLWMR